jgi:hypothetical protein
VLVNRDNLYEPQKGKKLTASDESVNFEKAWSGYASEERLVANSDNRSIAD